MLKSYVQVNGIFRYVRMHDVLSSYIAGHSSATVTAANVTSLCKVAVSNTSVYYVLSEDNAVTCFDH